MEPLKRIARYLYYRFIRIRSTPQEMARGVGLGIFIGFTPTLGVQTVAAIFVAAILRGNKFLAALGAGITNPVTIPFIYSGAYQLGASILNKRVDSEFLKHPTMASFWKAGNDLFLALWVGGIIVGAVAGILGYFLTLWLAPKLVLKFNRARDRLRRKNKVLV